MGRCETIIGAWRSVAKAQRVNSALQTLRDSNHHVLKNLEADPNIADATLEDLLRAWLYCEPYNADKLQERFLYFCSQNKYRGGKSPVATDPRLRNHRLGHVMRRQRLEYIIASLPAFTAVDKHARRAVDGVLEWDLAVQRNRLKAVPLTPMRQMWSFFDPRARNPFKNIGRKQDVLRDRLGMGHVGPGEPLMTFAHRLPGHLQPFVPTTFDAETCECFRPGGCTEPLTGSHGAGMPEVVHEPVTGESLEEAICPAII